MSIENFHSAYPPDEYFVKDISRRPEYSNMSPVALLADIYIKEGSNGLSQASYALAHKSESGVLKTNNEDKLIILNASAIYLGTALKTIEDIILSGEFDQKNLNTTVKNAFTGSILKPVHFIKPEVEEVDKFKHQLITKTAMEDKTFVSFFGHKYFTLPHNLKIYLAQTNMYHTINQILLPDYEKRVKKLITANEQRKRLKSFFD